MSTESFCVDVDALADVKPRLDGVRATVVAIGVGDRGEAAAAAAAPGCGAGIARFAHALDAFARAGATAIADDITTLGRTTAAYGTCELGSVRASESLTNSLGQ